MLTIAFIFNSRLENEIKSQKMKTVCAVLDKLLFNCIFLSCLDYIYCEQNIELLSCHTYKPRTLQVLDSS
jgi:hypothetical protein